MRFHLPLGWGKCNHRATLICPQSDCLEFYDWLQLSLHHGQNLTLVKFVYKTAPKSLFWAPPVYQDLSTRHDWPVKKAIVNLPIRMKGNSKRTSGNSLNPLGGPEQGSRHCFADVTKRGQISSATQASATGPLVKLKLRVPARIFLIVMTLAKHKMANVTTNFLVCREFSPR